MLSSLLFITLAPTEPARFSAVQHKVSLTHAPVSLSVPVCKEGMIRKQSPLASC